MTLSRPRVSIAVPVFNCEAWLEETLDAFLSQTWQDFELIICDNCSSDRTPAIAAAYAERDSRVRYHRNPRNLGAANNYNIAFELARGEYFKWSSCSDICAPTYLEECVAVLDADPTVVVAFPRTTLIDGEGEVVRKYEEQLHLMQGSPYERFETLLARIGLCNVEQALMRADVLRRTPLQGNFRNTDTILMAEMALHGKFFQIEKWLFFRRVTESATTNFATEEEWANFYLPGSKRLKGQRYKQLKAYLSIVPRAPVSLTDRLRLLKYCARLMLWARTGLWNDFVQSIGELGKRRNASSRERAGK